MTVSISTTGTRTSATLSVPVTVNIGVLPAIGNDTTDSLFLPVVFREFQTTPFVLTGVTAVSGTATFTLTEQQFSKVRVGDLISSISGGTVTVPSPATFTRTAKVYEGLDFIVLTGSSTLPKDGDSISGTGIGVSAFVKRVDTTTRTVYLSVVNTESSLTASPVTITVTPAIRVTTLNTTSRQVTLNGNFTGTGTDVSTSMTFTPSPFASVLYYLEAVHTTSTVDRLNVTVRAYPQTGDLAYDINGTGTDGTTIATVNPIPIGNFFINTDSYLTAARTPRINPA